MGRMFAIVLILIVADILAIGMITMLVSTCAKNEKIHISSDTITKAVPTSIDRINVKPNCQDYPYGLKGRLTVNSSYQPTELEAIQAAGEHVINGCYEPPDCVPTQTVAIIVPYKNRWEHLLTLLHHLHPILQRQKVKYCIFVPEQYDDGAFNKARIMNAGVMELLKTENQDFECLVFHDVDMLLEDDRNLHRCYDFPRHLSPAIDKFQYALNYGTTFGGVGAIKTGQYFLINGHTNRFYGWGGEDSDMEKRIRLNKFDIVESSINLGRYKMIQHQHPWYFSPETGFGSYYNPYAPRVRFIKTTDPSGLSTIKYSLISTEKHPLFTKITIDVRVFLIRSASSSFDDFLNKVEVANPFFITNSKQGSKKILGIGIEDTVNFSNTNCTFRKFPGKIIRRIYKENLDNDTIYGDLEMAKERCLELKQNCSAVFAKDSNEFVLRMFAYMHEKTLRYRTMRRSGDSVVSTYFEGEDTYVKICPKDSRFFQFLTTPVVIPESKYHTLRNVSCQLEFDMQIFHAEQFELYYSYTVYSTHKATLDRSEHAIGEPILEVNSLNNVISDKILVFDSGNVSSYKAFLGAYESLTEAADKHGILRVRIPSVSMSLAPGCYICESSLTDRNSLSHLKWKWWFEVRGSTADSEKVMLDRYLPSAPIGGSWKSQEFFQQRKHVLPYVPDAVVWLMTLNGNYRLARDEI